jgi:hypothetical protein
MLPCEAGDMSLCEASVAPLYEVGVLSLREALELWRELGMARLEDLVKIIDLAALCGNQCWPHWIHIGSKSFCFSSQYRYMPAQRIEITVKMSTSNGISWLLFIRLTSKRISLTSMVF